MRTITVRRRCLERGHLFREIKGVDLPFVFCSRLRCYESIPANHLPPPAWRSARRFLDTQFDRREIRLWSRP